MDLNEYGKHAVLDLYAGSGVGAAVKQLGAKEYGVEIMPAALATREANGMETIYHDAWEADAFAAFLLSLPDAIFTKWTHWMSPPCQLWSAAGTGAARKHKSALLSWLESGLWTDLAALRAECIRLGDEEYAHVLIPMHYIWRFRPDFVALEQVPQVIDLWRAYVPALERLGYSAKAEVLNSEQYGVPQTRKRAILVARRDGHEVQLPTPTHSRYHVRTPERLDVGVLPWVSMEEALSQPASQPASLHPSNRPAPTVTGGGVRTGGWEPFGPGGRRAILRSLSSATTGAAAIQQLEGAA